jgi:type VI secretion system protein ImpA
MTSTPILDFATLLAPFPGANPAGEALLFTETYDAIKEARRADDTLEQGDWRHDVKSADWSAVIALATTALATRSKDLQIAAWLVEALVKRHHFAGLRDGLQFLSDLQEHFWDTLHPAVEDGELEARLLVLEALNRVLPLAIRQVPITQGEAYSWGHWQQSREVDNLGRQNQQAREAALAEGKITGEQFDKAVATTSRQHCETLYADLTASWEAYQYLAQIVDTRFGREAPSLLEISKAITDGCRLLKDLVVKKRELEPDTALPPEPESPVDDTCVVEPATAAAMPAVQVVQRSTADGLLPRDLHGRAEALRCLVAVAAYFRRTEPHSPAVYLIERAVRWAQMPLDVWLHTVIRDESVLAQLHDMLGLQEGMEEFST